MAGGAAAGGWASRAAWRLEGLFRSPWFPRAIQLSLLLALVAIAYLAARRPQHSEMNTGAAIIWQLWWPLLPFSVIFFSRLWCAVCPFSLIIDLAASLRGRGLSTPSALMRRALPWMAALGLLVLGLAFLASALESNGPMTAWLLFLFASAAAGTGLLWRGKAWCRYLCPVGLMLGLYSRLGLLRLGASSESASMAAARSARGCPVYTTPISPRRSQDCLLCGSCLQSEEGRAVSVSMARPSLAGPRLAAAESVAVSLLFALLLVDVVRMTPLYLLYMSRAVPALRGSYELAMVLGIVGVVALVMGMQSLLAAVGRGSQGFAPAFSTLSVAVLPVAFAVQLGLSAQHLLITGEVVRNLGAELALLEPGHIPPVDAYSWLWPVKMVQAALLLAGAWAAWRTVAGGGRARGLNGTGIMGAVLVLLALFAQPMSVTC